MPEAQPSPRRILKRLRDAVQRARLPVQVEVRVTFECPEPWEGMAEVSQRVRHCARCDADVHDLRDLDRAGVLAHLQAQGGRLCGQVMARDDGRVVFGACAEGDRMVRGGLIADLPER